MKEEDIKIFVDIVINYFKEITGEDTTMGVPFVKNDNLSVLPYTGIIGISGQYRGGIYLSAEKELLEQVASTILGTDEVDESGCIDMLGEITNTIAGNARSSFGSQFMISVPIVIKGQPEDIFFQLKPPVFVIPIQWRKLPCFLAIGLEREGSPLLAGTSDTSKENR